MRTRRWRRRTVRSSYSFFAASSSPNSACAGAPERATTAAARVAAAARRETPACAASGAARHTARPPRAGLQQQQQHRLSAVRREGGRCGAGRRCSGWGVLICSDTMYVRRLHGGRTSVWACAAIKNKTKLNFGLGQHTAIAAWLEQATLLLAHHHTSHCNWCSFCIVKNTGFSCACDGRGVRGCRGQAPCVQLSEGSSREQLQCRTGSVLQCVCEPQKQLLPRPAETPV